MEVNVRTQKAFVRGYYTVKVSYTIVPWKKKMGLRYLYHGSHDLWPKKRKKTVWYIKNRIVVIMNYSSGI